MKKQFIPTLLFAIFMFGLFFADLFVPDVLFSEMENRPLNQFVPATYNSIIEGEFMKDYDSYINDQFIFRPQWITLKSVGESAMLKTENNAIVYGADNYMFDKSSIDTGDKSRLQNNLKYIIEFAEKNPEENIYFSLVPSSAQVYKEKLPTGLILDNQLDIIEKSYEGIGKEGIKAVELLSTDANNEQDYLYYKTDHHWTTKGAYLAYKEFINAVGDKPANLEGLEYHEVKGFYGTYYSKTKLFSAEPDVITYYNFNIENVTIDGKEKQGLYDLAKFGERDKYAGILYGNNGLTIINSAVKNGKTILVVKDSYGASMVPFLTENYEYIYMIDLRYYKDIQKLMSQIEFDDIYIIYYLINFSTDGNVINLLD